MAFFWSDRFIKMVHLTIAAEHMLKKVWLCSP